MQKKLIALAIAGFTSTAGLAQSNATIYGVMDASLESVRANDATTAGASRGGFGRVNSNSSYIGYKGTEDLGDGLKALFQFETGFSADTGVYTPAGRDTFVGLQGNAGTVKLGIFTGASRTIGTRLDLLPGRSGIGSSDSIIGRAINKTGGSATFFDTRLSNAIGYTTPTYNGFTGVINYAAGENKTLDSATAATQLNGKAYELGASYVNGPWYVAYAYGKRDTGASQTSTASSIINWKSNRIGAGYTFTEGHKINFIWDQQKQDLIGNTNLDKDAWSLQGLYKVSPAGSLIAAYSKTGDASGNYRASNAGTGAKEITLAYLHALSKRTMLKAVWSKISNDNNVAYDFGANGAAVGGSFGNGADPTGLALGVRHAF
ncbi:Putative Outer membrane porin protein 32 [Georgfuchsia toluolica]|uniref:Outer membrane porin protein 32 n=1 Tax=Georgfuchsia toluolica TaxID=424218 RepID=A0A916J4R9_9PROT|nr:porin [Georgfuchsia toluolica]CAG4883185.1 Putative Outer membrane porin protein 32 [Georgfuchsia toluolica]